MAHNLIQSTSIEGRVLAALPVSTTTPTLVYAPDPASAGIIKRVLVFNSTALPVGVTVWIGKAHGSTISVLNFNLMAGITADVTELVGACIGPGDSISFSVTTGGTVNVFISGVENS